MNVAKWFCGVAGISCCDVCMSSFVVRRRPRRRPSSTRVPRGTNSIHKEVQGRALSSRSSPSSGATDRRRDDEHSRLPSPKSKHSFNFQQQTTNNSQQSSSSSLHPQYEAHWNCRVGGLCGCLCPRLSVRLFPKCPPKNFWNPIKWKYKLSQATNMGKSPL